MTFPAMPFGDIHDLPKAPPDLHQLVQQQSIFVCADAEMLLAAGVGIHEFHVTGYVASAAASPHFLPNHSPSPNFIPHPTPPLPSRPPSDPHPGPTPTLLPHSILNHPITAHCPTPHHTRPHHPPSGQVVQGAVGRGGVVWGGEGCAFNIYICYTSFTNIFLCRLPASFTMVASTNSFRNSELMRVMPGSLWSSMPGSR